MPDDSTRCSVRCLHEEEVQSAKDLIMTSSGAITSAASVFSALGDETRLKMLYVLSLGRLCTCDLASALGITESAVSHQLRILKDLGLVRTERDGRIAYHWIANGALLALIGRGATINAADPAGEGAGLLEAAS